MLDPEIEIFLRQLKQLQLPPLVTLSPMEARNMAARLWRKDLHPVSVANVMERTIPGPAGEIRLRIYTPMGSGPFPLMVYFHGGGWVLGNLDSMDRFCRVLARDAACAIVSVDYRLAPEHKFPAAVEDAYAATVWVASHGTELKGNPDRVAVGGDSAGGTLAAAVTLMARDRKTPHLCWQLLLYPVTQYEPETASYQSYGDGSFGLSQAEMAWFWQHYLSHPADGQNPLASPLLTRNFRGLPPAHILTAEYDVLRDEGEAYAAKLQQAGVPVQLKRYDGAIHSFVALWKLRLGTLAIADIVSQAKLSL